MSTLNKLRSSAYFDLILGSVISQGISSISILYISFLVGASNFGKYSVILSISIIISVLMTLRLEIAIGTSQSSHKAIAALWLGMFNSILVFTVVFLGILIFHRFFLFDFTTYLTASVLAFSISVWNLLQYYILRYKLPRDINYMRLFTVILQSMAQIVLFRSNLYSALAWGHVLSLLIISLLTFGIYKEIRGANIQQIKDAVREQRNVIKFTAPAAMIGTASLQIIPILLSYKYGNSTAGQYALAYRLIGFPLGVIGASAGQAFLRIASESIDNIKREAFYIIRKLSLVSCFFFIMFSAFSRFIDVVLGKDWIGIGNLVPIFSLIFIINIITSPISSIPVTMNKNIFSLRFTTFELLARLLIILLPVKFINDVDFFLMFSITSSLINWVYFLLVMKIVDAKLLDSLVAVLPTAIVYGLAVLYYISAFISRSGGL
jgi:O-antigen/teichoic acid export membrane protein